MTFYFGSTTENSRFNDLSENYALVNENLTPSDQAFIIFKVNSETTNRNCDKVKQEREWTLWEGQKVTNFKML